MTTFTLFTDPHLGTRRAAHTTRESSQRLQHTLYLQARAVTENASNPICLGDLFDRSFNDEATLVQGFDIANRCVVTLAGNHDSSNRVDTVTTIDALHAMGVSVCKAPDLSKPFYDFIDPGIYLVPHHASQEIFEKAMFHAAEHACHHREGKASVLMLHCNYNQPFAKEDDTLNLSEDVAGRLLNAFDYIFLGHEHKPATHFDGRVVILGNTHPTSFGDVTDKFAYELSITDESLDLTKTLIWSKADRYREIKFGEAIPDLTGVQFVDVIGHEDAAEGTAIAQFTQEVWEAGDKLLAVRNNVKIGDHLGELEDIEAPALENLAARIMKDLEGTDLQGLYAELVKEAEA